jgi:hypothetical protein
VTNLAWSLFTFDEFHIELDALLDGAHDHAVELGFTRVWGAR